MTGFSTRFALLATIAAGALIAGAMPVAAADGPNLLGAFRDWSAYTTGTDSGKVCYVLSQPKSTDPRNVKRDPIFFLISDWPGRKAKAEPEVVPGYPYKDGSKVTAQVGSDKFTFFTKNDGNDGGAWVQEKADEARLVDAMRRGSQMIVTGTSSRGTLTKDVYSLLGVSNALDRAHKTCGM